MTHLKKIQQKKAPQGPDITIEEAITELKYQIVEEVRALADGRRTSIFQIVDMGKELIELETRVLEEVKRKAKKEKEQLMFEF